MNIFKEVEFKQMCSLFSIVCTLTVVHSSVFFLNRFFFDIAISVRPHYQWLNGMRIFTES